MVHHALESIFIVEVGGGFPRHFEDGVELERKTAIQETCEYCRVEQLLAGRTDWGQKFPFRF